MVMSLLNDTIKIKTLRDIINKTEITLRSTTDSVATVSLRLIIMIKETCSNNTIIDKV